MSDKIVLDENKELQESTERENKAGMGDGMMPENKMGVMPVNRLLIGMSLPMMMSMLVQALYNIVDSIFVAMVSQDAVTAVSLAFPVQMLSIAVAGGTSVGVNAVLSKALGEKNQERVNKSAANGIFIMALSYLLFLLIGAFLVRPFFAMQKVGSPAIGEYGVKYLSICCIFSFGVFTQFIFERLLQSTGKTFYAMITQGVGAIINLILDPILIFGLWGFPELGIAGAAYATVIGQIVAGLVAMFMNYKFNPEVKVSFKKFRPDGKIIGKIYAVGFPSIIMQSIGSVMNYGFNQILLSFTDTAAAVFGIYFKLQSFFFMPVFGLTNGLIPILAYNYGARKKERMLKSFKLSILYAEIILIAGTLCFQFAPHVLLGFFSPTEELLEIGQVALRIISLSFPIAAFCIVSGTMFQALGNGIYSMWVSIARQLAVLLPVAFLMSLTGNLSLVWLSFPIAEGASLLMTLIFLFRIYKKVIKNL